MSIRKLFREITGWILVILIPALIVFVLNMKVFAISGVNQQSMHNTLFEGDVLYFNRFADKINELKKGDIVLFLTDGREKQGFWDEIGIKIADFADKFKKKDDRTNKRYVKRIVGMPGDVIEITSGGEVYINQEKEAEDYLVGSTPPGNLSYPLIVPEGHLFVMGDNREISKDSRHFGCVSIRSVEGKASFIMWPASRIKAVK